MGQKKRILKTVCEGVDSSEQSSKPSSYMKDGKCVEQLNDYQLLNKNSASWSLLVG